MIVLFILALLGHAFLWVTMINRFHGTGIGGRPRDAATILGFAGLLFIPLAYAFLLARTGGRLLGIGGQWLLPWPALAYLGLAWLGAAVTLVGWVRRHVFHRPPAVLRYHRRRLLDVADASAPAGPEDEHHFLVRLPGNEILQLDVAERGIEIARLPAALDRLSIAHLSDFHFTGRVGKSYFQEVIRLANELAPDLVCITGDLVDEPDYLAWVSDTLGQLQSRYGTYFVLGNHDRQIDHARLRHVLAECGLVDLGRRWVDVDVRGQRVILAGNEQPWFPIAADLAHAPCRAEGAVLRIALSHSPDELAWARAHDIDLLLAGHTHGGQIRLPLIGPIFSPSRMGVKYAWGVYHAPPTILHVTRGVSGEFPVRMNCPPEIVRLVLRVPHG